MKTGGWFLKLVGGFVAGLIFLILIYFLSSDQKGTSKFISEAEKLRQDNRQTELALPTGQVELVRRAGKDDFYWGKLGAKAELVVYSDFDCGFCASYYKILEQVKNEFGDKVAIVFRHYPLEGHANAVLAAQGFECARDQGKASEMASKLFDNQTKNDNNTTSLLTMAKDLGLKEDQFKDCLTSEKYLKRVLDQKEEAKRFGIIGSPSSFLNGRPLPGAYQFEDFSDQTGRKYDGLKTLINNEINK
jgi:protein-disulfide isomerase